MSSTVLLATEEVILYAPDGQSDSHGWTLPPEPVLFWTGLANVQVSFGNPGTGANVSGGKGPFQPLTSFSGLVYLPEEAAPKDGMVLQDSKGNRFTLAVCRWVSDPSGGGIGCYSCTLTGYAGG